MFSDLPAAPRATGDTAWSTPLSERLGDLFSRPRRVAWLYRTPDTSTFRYRAANMVAAINAHDGDIGAAWFSETELSTIQHLVPELDAVVLVRYPWSGPLQRLVDKAQHHGVPLVFDVDDLVFDTGLVPLIMDALHVDLDDFANWSGWFGHAALLHETLITCSSAITTGRPLAERLAPRFSGGPVSVVPNFLDREQDDFSRVLLDAKRDRGFRSSGPVTLGYFSGTPTHARDFAVAVPALVRLLERDPDVRLRLVGRLDVAQALEDFEDRVDVLPFMTYIELQRAIAEVDVNLAPLQSSVFTACKSELKYFEAAAVGTWTVASAAPMFAAAIDDGHTGRVARPWEWDDALEEAVALVRNPDEYAVRAEHAAQSAYDGYGWDVHGPTVERALASSWRTRVDGIASVDTKGDRP